MDKQYLYNMYNATSTADEDDPHEIESYENWLERQLISRIERIEELELLLNLKDRGIVIIGSEDKNLEQVLLEQRMKEANIALTIEPRNIPEMGDIVRKMPIPENQKTGKKRKRNHFTKRYQ